MKKILIAAGFMALAAVPMTVPAFAQTVVVTPGASEPPPPPPEPSTVIVTPPPPPQPTVSCAETTTKTDRIIGSKTETRTDCVHTQ
jgi:hypothetical protein